MFSVLFEVKPWASKRDAYLDMTNILRSQLERVGGFINNIQYKSLTRDEWMLSLSEWRDEKSLVRWRNQISHHEVQELGRTKIFEDYRFRVGQVTDDTQLPEGQSFEDQRLDETEVGEGTTVTLIGAKRPGQWMDTFNPADCSEYLGLNPYADGIQSWDVYEAALTSGDLLLALVWRDDVAANAFEDTVNLPGGAHARRLRIVRDYGMFDRREAPQYYPAQTPFDEECAH
jgi:heme-degrading monooxygenase HmoA